jgi:hypothetical protein
MRTGFIWLSVGVNGKHLWKGKITVLFLHDSSQHHEGVWGLEI